MHYARKEAEKKKKKKNGSASSTVSVDRLKEQSQVGWNSCPFFVGTTKRGTESALLREKEFGIEYYLGVIKVNFFAR